ncbi:hypothetical protein CKM354_001013800 [Cercospora kikuchii]|uniref:Uncharacterized protein n=1 Tax=Cercospora kikuchii TaxID=84275 RepID=A0A9P3CPN1_9PEZI|nr:uncharacterized protein CKM354_001013800 [Cercospora kikuchii]GIZ47037.1 hypothetical protein CKM354_001013800 [Cercospora kikuchii]
MERPTAMHREQQMTYSHRAIDRALHRNIAVVRFKPQSHVEHQLSSNLLAIRMDYYFMVLFTFYAILVDFVRKCSLATAERIFFGKWIWGYNPRKTIATDPDQKGENESVAVDDQYTETEDASHGSEVEKHEKLPVNGQEHTDSDISSDPDAPYSNIPGAWHFGWRFAAPISILFITRHSEDLLEQWSSKKTYTMTESEKEWRLVTALSLAFLVTLAADVWAVGTCLVVKGMQKVAGMFHGNDSEESGRI